MFHQLPPCPVCSLWATQQLSQGHREHPPGISLTPEIQWTAMHLYHPPHHPVIASGRVKLKPLQKGRRCSVNQGKSPLQHPRYRAHSTDLEHMGRQRKGWVGKWAAGRRQKHLHQHFTWSSTSLCWTPRGSSSTSKSLSATWGAASAGLICRAFSSLGHV